MRVRMPQGYEDNDETLGLHNLEADKLDDEEGGR
jgi:hypothetical protein